MRKEQLVSFEVKTTVVSLQGGIYWFEVRWLKIWKSYVGKFSLFENECIEEEVSEEFTEIAEKGSPVW